MRILVADRRLATARTFLAAILALLLAVPWAVGGTDSAAATPRPPRSPAASAAKPPPHLSDKLQRTLAAVQAGVTTRRGLARATSTSPQGPGSILRSGDDYVVQVRATDVDRGVRAALRRAGARILGVYPAYDAVTAVVPLDHLRSVAAVRAVEYVSEVIEPMVGRRGSSGRTTDDPITGTSCGSVTSEGDVQLKADQARSTFGVDGSGIEVGVLSDSFNATGGAGADVASGDLPGPGNPCGRTAPVQVLADTAGADEGRAMLQLVHDLAPGATVAFRTAFLGELDFAQGIVDLRNAGADVIVDDVTYFDEPFYQDGPVAAAVSQVVASGASYFSSAGNSNLVVGGKNVSSWEAPAYRPTACPTGVPSYEPTCMDFDPGAGTDATFGVTLAPGQRLRVDLQWAEAWDGVVTDLDMYLLNPGNTVVAMSEVVNNGTGSQQPFELFEFTNGSGATQTYRIAIGRYDGTATPRLKFAFLNNGAPITSTEYPDSAGGDVVGPTIFGHNGGESGHSVAAVPFDDASTVESFSSRGPVTHLFAPVSGTTPAPPVPALVLPRPTMAATDGGLTTFFGPGHRFYGTSAAAPHAAAVAALLLDADPTLTPDEVSQALTGTARPVGGFGENAVGDGLVDALAAVGSVAPPVVRCDGLAATVVGSGTVNGTAGADVIVGSAGVDTINGGGGSDTVCGLGGNDTIVGGTGADHVIGGPGNDVFPQGAVPDGSDVVDGTEGADVVSYAARTTAVSVTLGDSVGNDGAPGEGDRVVRVERVTGGSGSDRLTGNGVANLLSGGRGNDSLDGLGGGDDLTGGRGADRLAGNAGRDRLRMVDHVRGNDRGDGGPGTDRASADPRDVVRRVP